MVLDLETWTRVPDPIWMTERRDLLLADGFEVIDHGDRIVVLVRT